MNESGFGLERLGPSRSESPDGPSYTVTIVSELMAGSLYNRRSASRRSGKETGRMFLLALLPLLLYLGFGLYGPVVGWLIMDSLPTEIADVYIARLIFGDYGEPQYAAFLLFIFTLTVLGGLLSAWLVLRPILPSIRAGKLVAGGDVLRAEWRVFAVTLAIFAASFALGSLLAAWGGTPRPIFFPLGHLSYFSIELLTGGVVGFFGFLTAIGFLALFRWGFQQVVLPSSEVRSLEGD